MSCKKCEKTESSGETFYYRVDKSSVGIIACEEHALKMVKAMERGGINNPTDNQTLNQQYGLTEVYQCDLDDTTQECKKCHTHIKDLIGKPKLCAVVGKEEFSRLRIGDYNDWK